MSNILITGATGNVGIEVVRHLKIIESSDQIIAGVRNIEKAKLLFAEFSGLEYRHFDFEDEETFAEAFSEIDRVFLLRPPHISDVKQFFEPLIDALKKKRIKQVVFLSVQGAEKSKVIPHNKIERLIKSSGLDYIFLRPSYFMQNLTTTLLQGIQSRREIVLPAGKAKFNWVDICNIGEAGAVVLNQFDDFKNQEIEITGKENEDFHKVTCLINQILHKPVTYKSVSPCKFYRLKRLEEVPKGMIIVMILLHFIPRFQKEPKISDSYEQLIGKKPTDLASFIKREQQKFGL